MLECLLKWESWLLWFLVLEIIIRFGCYKDYGF